MKMSIVVLAAISLSGVAIAKSGPSAVATVTGPDGVAHGTVTAVESKKGLTVTYKAVGLPAGEHGVHIHMTGKCEAPGFTTAGGHWNPTGKMHGSMNPMGPHAGDLPNLKVGANGKGVVSFTVPGATLATGEEALLDADGAAFVVHAAQDDLKTDPSGNSGGRIACGVFSAK